jgi:hypothetical protein
MSVMLADIYIPFDRGPGAQANIERWRKMAQLFARSGVVRTKFMQWPPTSGEQNPLSVFHWDGSNLYVAPGACWVNGFYGRNYAQKGLPTTEPGLVVARLDPLAQEIRLVHRPGVEIGGEIKDPNGWWEMPLAHFSEAVGITDLRVFTPLEILPPPITEIPPWVPRGRVLELLGPDTEVRPPFSEPTNILVAYPSSYGWFVAGRHYRFTFLINNTVSGGIVGLRTWAADESGLRHTQQAWQGQVLAIGNIVKTTSFVVRNCRPGFVAVIEGTSNNGNNFFAPMTCRIEIEDVGAP